MVISVIGKIWPKFGNIVLMKNLKSRVLNIHVYWPNVKCYSISAPLNPYANREETAQIMFETLDVPAFYLSVQ